ncbi:hypothetical protein L560_0344 [Bordetella pertussis STO1-CHOC-0018]|nr:hypothetical protein L560_0344 [Bordetella pertussis STO1-CHOC-0018]
MLRRGGAAVRFRLFCLKTKSPAACGRGLAVPGNAQPITRRRPPRRWVCSGRP